MVQVRRDLHRHPELSHDEHRTMERIADQLSDLGIEAKTHVGGTGVIADLPGATDGPLVALRADTDALPITERTGLPFASVHPGVMHACGHDGHTAMAIGAAAMLRDRPTAGPVRLLFQPAEETGMGAQQLIDAGALTDVALIFGGHIDRLYPTGTLVVSEGAVNASTDTLHLSVRGRGGHGARPHETVDAVHVGCALVCALQGIVSRQIDPASPAVVTIGHFAAGQAANVIAATAVLTGTLRAHDAAVRTQLAEAVRRVAAGVAAAHRAEIDVRIEAGTPAVINTSIPTALARRAAVEVVGAPQVRPLHPANMGGEDFAVYLEHVPGAYIRFGARPPQGPSHPAHSPEFDFDEGALAVGAAWLAEVASVASDAVVRASG